MLSGLHSLSSQKKGAIYSFVLLAAVALLVAGVLSVTAAHSKTITFSPIFAAASANQSYNFSISLGSGSATINEIRITKPADFTAVYCLFANPVGGWSCATNGTTSAVSYVEFTGGTLAAGSSIDINITSTSAAGAANYSFTVRTLGNGEAANTSNVNVTVDPNPPVIDLVNITDGTTVLTKNEMNGLFFLNNATKGIVFVINATDNSSGMAQGRVAIYYNVSNVGFPANFVPNYQNASVANVSEFVASNGTFGQLSLYNVTLNLSAMPTLNGSKVVFTILANDSVHNGNVSNATILTAAYAYNFTIDAVAPQFVDVIITNQSLNSTTARAINFSKAFGSLGGLKYIINSSLVLNVTALVRDDGGSGTVRVEVMNRSGAFMPMELLVGTNGSSSQTSWTLNGSSPNSNVTFNITTLVKGFSGDGLYNLTFRATDNASNQNFTYNFSVEVDDTPPGGSVTSNLTISGTTQILSAGNTTLSNTTLNVTSFTLRLMVSGNNLNNQTANVSVRGQVGGVWNMSYESGSSSAGTSTWNFTIANGTTTEASRANLTDFCNGNLAGDGTSCSFRFNFSDVMGRYNDTLNLTVFVDSNAPAVLAIMSPNVSAFNYSGSALINVSINDTVGPLQNVSFRIVRGNTTAVGATATGGEGFYNTTTANLTTGDVGFGDTSLPANVTNWIPMTLNAGNNSQPNNGGFWNFTINLTAINLTDGNYTIQINATDSAGRSNATVNMTAVIFDSTIPQNITLITVATNSFQRVNFTVNINATERISGLKNVTVRLENGTHNSPWVGVQQAFPSALSSITQVGQTVRFNATAFNITHIGLAQDNISLNATNGNFTLRLNVTDTAGNQNTSITINFTIDTVVPYGISITFPGNNQNQSTNFTLNVSVNNESNINTVQYRWENGTYVDATSIGANVSDWINMNSIETVNNSRWNSTFNITQGTAANGNFTIAINVTDKAGNSNTSALGNSNNSALIQLLLDQSRPEVVETSGLANSVQTGSFVINMTTRDNRSFLNVMGLFNVSNINATSVRLENSTFNSSYQNISFVTTDLGNVGNSNRTNVTFEFTSVANGLYNMRFWVNDTAGNQNNSVVVTNITLDNVGATVSFSINNITPSITGGAGVSGNVTFNVSVTDNIPLNVSVNSNTTVQGNQYGVFYRFENSTFNGSWLAMSTSSFQDAVISNSTGRSQTAVYNASNFTITLADGDYKIRVNVTDKSNNQNTTQTISLTIQNGGSKVRAVNLTFQGGIFNGFANSSTDSYTFLVNTTANATCRYSLDTAITFYDDMTSTMSNNVSREHSISFGPFRDVAASGHTLYYACKDVGGNFTASEGAASQFPFGVDTRNRFNVTVPGKTDNKWPNYLQAASAGAANGWSSFTLSTLALSDTTLNSTAGGYNVTNVLSSLLQGTAAGNFTKVYAYNASTNTWQSFRVGQTGNSFINFSDQTEYWINITQTERIEVR